jgi:hypothetical protein
MKVVFQMSLPVRESHESLRDAWAFHSMLHNMVKRCGGKFSVAFPDAAFPE